MQPHKDRLDALRSEALHARSIALAEALAGIIAGPVNAMDAASIKTVFFISLPFANTASSYAKSDARLTYRGSMPDCLGYFNFDFAAERQQAEDCRCSRVALFFLSMQRIDTRPPAPKAGAFLAPTSCGRVGC
jgi:hypothetical protein